MTKLDELKQKCRQLSKHNTRQLSRIQTEAELLDFVTRRQITIPGFSPSNFQLLAPINHYHVEVESRFTPTKPQQTTELLPVNVQEMVVNEIGRKWKQFGRALDIPESFLDELEERHPRKLQERIHDMLKQVYAGDNALPRIKSALERVGRKDLAMKITL